MVSTDGGTNPVVYSTPSKRLRPYTNRRSFWVVWARAGAARTTQIASTPSQTTNRNDRLFSPSPACGRGGRGAVGIEGPHGGVGRAGRNLIAGRSAYRAAAPPRSAAARTAHTRGRSPPDTRVRPLGRARR